MSVRQPSGECELAEIIVAEEEELVEEENGADADDDAENKDETEAPSSPPSSTTYVFASGSPSLMVAEPTGTPKSTLKRRHQEER